MNTRSERRATARFRHAALGAIICWATIATFGIVAFGINTINDHHALKAVQGAELRSCHRLNIQRAEANHNNYADWRFDSLFIRLLKAGINHQTANVRRNPKQVHETQLFIASLQDSADAKSWIPLTDCPNAVYADALAPPAILFTKQQPPPGALTPGPRN